jgi:hyperosmotically inducible periplasmic protein
MKLSHSMSWLAAALLAASVTAGCNRNDSSTSDAGKAIDQAEQDAGRKTEQATDQVKEQAAKGGDKIDDAAITAKVKAAMVGEPGLKALKIEVDTADGVVTLTGTVDSSGHIDRATQVAQAVDGVKSVDNRLTVRTG